MSAGPAGTGGLLVEVRPVGALQCNCVLLVDPATREAIVVDPGDEADAILARVEALGCQVREIVHTHTHIDHVGATDAVRRATGAKSGLHRADLFLLEMLDVQASWLGCATPPAAPVDRELVEGDRLAFGGRHLDVLHTPGHTPGSLVFVTDDRDGPLVCAGDTLFAGSIGRTDLPGGDPEAIVRSIQRKLYALPDEARVIPGHGPMTTIGRERRHNAFVRGV